MNRILRVMAGLALVSANPLWCATPNSAKVNYPVSMQCVGTFEDQPPTAKITMVSAADEFEPASFTAKSGKTLSGVSFKVEGDLKSGKSALKSGQLRISAVEGCVLRPNKPVDLSPGITSRFWITVGVPRGTAPGVYKGAITASSGGKTVGKLPIEVTVLSIRLLKSSRQYGYELSPGGSEEVPYHDVIRRLPDYGFSLTSIFGELEPAQDPNGRPMPTIADSVQECRKVGVDAVTYCQMGQSVDQIAQVFEAAKALGIYRLFYDVTFSSYDHNPDLDSSFKLAQEMRQRGLNTYAVIGDQATYEKLTPLLDCTDVHIDLPYVQGLLAGEKPAKLRHDWIYWDITADAMTNRLNAGFILWKTGLYGVFIPCHSSISNPARNVEPLFQTIQWEALREGVDDTRYMTITMKALREVKDALKVGGTKNAVQAKQLADNAESYINSVMAKPLKELKNSDCQAIRAKLAGYAKKLSSMLKA